MKCGDIYGFYTRQVGNGRYKYHLYLCEGVGKPKKYIFMLISSSGRRDDCMSIDRSDWPSMKKRQSFICLPQLFGYSGHVLQHFKPKLRGRLSDATLSKLMNHVAESETMSESDIDTVIDALRGYFEN